VKTKMVSIKQTANEYVAPKTMNISDLDRVSVDMDLKTKRVGEGTPDEFSYDYIIFDDQEYRVPKSVIKQLNVQLSANPDLKEFSVAKTGSTVKDTVYTVIPLL